MKTSAKDQEALIHRDKERIFPSIRRVRPGQDLTQAMNNLTMMTTETSRLAWLESELKLKNFELKRCSLLLEESEQRVGTLSGDKEILLEKLNVVKDEYTRLQLESEHKQSMLESKLNDLHCKLTIYEKQEDDLDKLILDGASLPEDSDSRALTIEYACKVPSTAKRRLEQSIALARKAIELEKRCNDLKASLFAERDERSRLEEQLDEMKLTVSLSSYPTAELLQLIRQRDRTIVKLKTELGIVLAREQSLRKDVTAMEEYKIEIENCIRKFIRTQEKRAKIKRQCSIRHQQAQDAQVQAQRNEIQKRRLPWCMTLNRAPLTGSSLNSNVIAALKLKHPLTLTKIPKPPT